MAQKRVRSPSDDQLVASRDDCVEVLLVLRAIKILATKTARVRLDMGHEVPQPEPSGTVHVGSLDETVDSWVALELAVNEATGTTRVAQDEGQLRLVIIPPSPQPISIPPVRPTEERTAMDRKLHSPHRR